MPSKVVWLGDEVKARMVEKALAAVSLTTKAAADEARQNHWWSSRTGNLEGNVISTPAVIEAGLVKSKFGATLRREGFYGLFLERRIPWLRPAADRVFPTLKATLRRL